MCDSYTIKGECYSVFNKMMVVLILLVIICLTLAGCARESNQTINMEGGEEEIFNHAVDDFFAAVDARDEEAVKKLFAPSVLAKTDDIDESIEQLFTFYAGPTDSCKRDGGQVEGKYRNEHGKRRSEISEWFAVVSGETTYYCDFSLVYESDSKKEDIGIQTVSFVSEKAICSEEFGWSNDLGINVIEDAEGDYLTRRAWGYPMIFTPIERLITQNDILSFLETSTGFQSLKEQFGEPNAEKTPYTAYIYELEKENGEERYLNFSVDDDEIIEVAVGSKEDYLDVLWKKED